MRPQFLLSLTVLAGTTMAQITTQLYNFTSPIAIENSALRPNGHLLLTTFNNGSLYTLNPSTPNPEAKLVTALPGATAICGITAIDTDKFVIVGGVRGSYHYDNETLYTIDFSDDAARPVVDIVAYIPDAEMLNGMASLPTRPYIVLVADSRLGSLFRVDTITGLSEVVFANSALAAPSNASMPIGINGLKIVGEYVYFTNSALNIFAKIPVSDDGMRFGRVQIIARLDAITSGSDWDDFFIDADGNAYIAQPTNALARVTPAGTVSVFAGGGDSLDLVGPTSVQIAAGGRVAYVTTRGGTVWGFTYGGQVVAVKLD
ncbi:hypothetical protein PENANT_c036G02427 [Penicillium antarcticum]|uniref:SMP-30/Gluconolactonase/LRE-like region domain-containing protein n=1 Tax=Penicillium antarcticum TaxID=416450 RepID=A0A1V6PTH6_9EURO|nr:uncharacterized protein N7508_002008 [Penicillium antarcticum]KAJ5317500.1 hypothetical protein N7508_002008 [Penicillium antarcticum]OQD80340.1 hypothetical protein PENANT_c036G02427 [Penicillium antarcticum]